MATNKAIFDTLHSYANSTYRNNRVMIQVIDWKGEWKPVFFGGVNIFKTEGIAIRRIVERTGATKEQIKEFIKEKQIRFVKCS
jgi:hypothetical protein